MNRLWQRVIRNGSQVPVEEYRSTRISSAVVESEPDRRAEERGDRVIRTHPDDGVTFVQYLPGE